MAAAGKKLRRARGSEGYVALMHWCPGCDEPHGIRIEGTAPGPKWSFNGDFDKPHFNPSILCFTIEDEDDNGKPMPKPVRRTLCHYFIHNGKIVFCGDSPHKLAGKTVDIPDWPYASGAYGGIDE